MGELIAAVTDEVMPIIRDRSARYMVVSYIVSDLLAQQRVRGSQAVTTKTPSHFAQATTQEK